MDQKTLRKITKKLVEAQYLIGIIKDRIYRGRPNRSELKIIGQKACDALAKAIVLATGN